MGKTERRSGVRQRSEGEQKQRQRKKERKEGRKSNHQRQAQEGRRRRRSLLEKGTDARSQLKTRCFPSWCQPVQEPQALGNIDWRNEEQGERERRLFRRRKRGGILTVTRQGTTLPR